MRFFRFAAAVALLAMGQVSVTCAEDGSRSSSLKWISDAVDHATAEGGRLPGAEAARCAESFRSASTAMLDAVGAMPIDLSGPLVVVYFVGQGFESTAVSAIGTNKDGKPMIAFDDLSSREHRILTTASAIELDRVVRAAFSGEIKSMTGVEDGECVMVIRRGESRLFPPGYGVDTGQEDALQRLKVAIDDAFSPTASAHP